MKYTMKAGALSANEKILARLKGGPAAQEKKVFLSNGAFALRTCIRNLAAPHGKENDIRFRQYVMFDAAGKQCGVARPGYAKDDDPAIVGWPICRMPSVNRTLVSLHGERYQLTMQSIQNYVLTAQSGRAVVQILHKGLAGGWSIEADDKFPPEIICGIFLFCRYIEQENEFNIV